MSNRNKVRQVIPIYEKDENGNSIKNKQIGENIVFHEKEFNKPKYKSYKEFWDMANQSPKPKSKRQLKIKEEYIS